MTAKTTMTIAQILFILAGIGLGFWLLGSGGSAGQTITAGLVSVGLLLFGVGAFVIVQRQGMFGWILALLTHRSAHPVLEAREQQLLELDRTIAGFYSHQRQAFLLSTGLFLLGLARGGYGSLRHGAVHGAIDLTCCRLSPLVPCPSPQKGRDVFIPGSLGAQGCGQSVPPPRSGTGSHGYYVRASAALSEFVWIALGLGCLAMMTTKVPILPLHKIIFRSTRDLCQAETDQAFRISLQRNFSGRCGRIGPPRLH